MNVAACLLLYSFAVAVLGPRLLARLTRDGVAPRLGLAAWLAAIGSVVGSWAASAVLLAIELLRNWSRPGLLVSTCLTALRTVATGQAGVVLQTGFAVIAAVFVVAMGASGCRLWRSLARARSRTHQHAELARVAGRALSGSEAVVLETPERVVYCVAGRPSTIVVTTGALDVLDERHLGAVLAHERAHLAGHHHLVVAVTRGLAAIAPRVELFTAGARAVARLLEMCADDAAVRTHGSRTVLGALLTLSGAAALPPGGLGATGVGVLARAERLAEPAPVGRQLRVRLVLIAAAVLLGTGPLVTVLLAAAGLVLCAPLPG